MLVKKSIFSLVIFRASLKAESSHFHPLKKKASGMSSSYGQKYRNPDGNIRQIVKKAFAQSAL